MEHICGDTVTLREATPIIIMLWGEGDTAECPTSGGGGHGGIEGRIMERIDVGVERGTCAGWERGMEDGWRDG
jgi:hypothetical protein